MKKWMSVLWIWLSMATVSLLSLPASSHELTMAELNMREIAYGQFYWSWGSAGAVFPGDELTPVWPEDCTDENQQLFCEGGLVGEVAIDGIGKNYSATMMRVSWLDGQRRVYTLTQSQTSIRLYGAADDQRAVGDIAWAYTGLGIKHILGGIDHLLFVICLLFLVGFNRKLVWTITAFTVAHSLTLGASVLGFITLRSNPVEAVIALSIVLIAAESLSKQRTLTKDLPVLVAFVFGLVHGLGFAGVLEEIGLPEHQMLLALATFNIGVEIGQLLTVAAAWLVVRLLRPIPQAQLARVPALYVIGTLAAFWSIDRLTWIIA